MSTEKHTEGEWKIRKQDVVCEGEPGLFVYVIDNEAGMLFTLDKDSLPLAKSIVAAHNNTYAAGLNPEAMPGLVEAGQTLCDSLQAIWDDTPETDLSLDLGRRVVLAREAWTTALAAAKKGEPK